MFLSPTRHPHLAPLIPAFVWSRNAIRVSGNCSAHHHSHWKVGPWRGIGSENGIRVFVFTFILSFSPLSKITGWAVGWRHVLELCGIWKVEPIYAKRSKCCTQQCVFIYFFPTVCWSRHNHLSFSSASSSSSCQSVLPYTPLPPSPPTPQWFLIFEEQASKGLEIM